MTKRACDKHFEKQGGHAVQVALDDHVDVYRGALKLNATEKAALKYPKYLYPATVDPDPLLSYCHALTKAEEVYTSRGSTRRRQAWPPPRAIVPVQGNNQVQQQQQAPHGPQQAEHEQDPMDVDDADEAQVAGPDPLSEPTGLPVLCVPGEDGGVKCRFFDRWMPPGVRALGE
jgi:hypothetical protein